MKLRKLFPFLDNSKTSKHLKQSRIKNSNDKRGSESYKPLGPPRFTSETKSSPERYIARIGDKLSIFCQAQGYPAPVISWFKDGKPIDTIAYAKR